MSKDLVEQIKAKNKWINDLLKNEEEALEILEEVNEEAKALGYKNRSEKCESLIGRIKCNMQ